MLLVLIGLGLGVAMGAENDRYANFAELARAEKAGVDYRIEVRDREHARSVLAIHGGHIEAGTAELARKIAGADWNLYVFEGLKSEGNRVLHLTSAHFDEPRARALARKSRLCLSLHGFASQTGTAIACIGGGNACASCSHGSATSRLRARACSRIASTC